MRVPRGAAAAAVILTVLLLQATLVAPLAAPWPVSLPAVLVAAVAAVEGPGTGLALGFGAGLLADLGSAHPAGVLALTWLGVGVVCGMLAGRRGVRDALTVAAVCGAAGSVATVLLAAVDDARALDAVRGFAPTVLGDLLLAVPVLFLVRRLLATEALRRPHPVGREVSVRG